MEGEWSRFLEIIRGTSFKAAPEPVFRLASGRLSRYYVDCKQALSYPEARALLGKLIFEQIKGRQFDAIGGLEIGAYPIATAVSDAIYQRTGASVRVFVVRKEAKDHGVGKMLAGDAKAGDRTLIVDDVITSGKSTIDALERARQAGLNVTHVMVLVDRQEDRGKANIEAHGVSCASLFTLPDLINAAAAVREPATVRSE
ncbi:MAG: orotate phosphoribosyltransferase [Candidatus Binataceae bacterium]